MKYKRATYQYRNAGDRQKDWDEIYNHKSVVEGLRMQAARFVLLLFLQGDGGGRGRGGGMKRNEEVFSYYMVMKCWTKG